MIEASWKKGMESFFDADPNKVAQELHKLGEEVTPQQIVDFARQDTTELHRCFDWDDHSAAEKYRQCQARKVLQLLVIKNTEESEEKPEIRMYFKTEASSGYKPATVIFRNDNEYNQLLQTALMELRAFKKKYDSLKELSAILALID